MISLGEVGVFDWVMRVEGMYGGLFLHWGGAD